MKNFLASCSTCIDGSVAVWIDKNVVTMRAFGVHWRLTRDEATALAEDIESFRESGNPTDRAPLFEVFEWNDDEVAVKSGESTLILGIFDADDLVAWLKEAVE